ncbi:conserved Plasmodium membrane protein, unknown function [Plasmodium gallinaceum]|uniref:Uncharacterized protein n=1 Tax=Plasmodium gallinaceum TaxID=5849 RepID=A0A1J1GZW5_PLAGA|nr:conserved Plasmodium membrane protein, unknown function [Plasmodium gallinaceum]CRG96564.1 conserved Plasmodium membrane protein, unknown function [Plasmodium gallinaceum]
MIKKKLLNFFNYFYCIKNCYIYHIIFLYIFFLRITYTYAEITISHFFTYLLSKYENLEKSKKEENIFYYFTNFFNFNNRNSDKFLNTKLFVVVYLPICLKCFYTLFFDYVAYYVYIHYYFKKINEDFKKVYYSSLPHENQIYRMKENINCKKRIRQDKKKKKKKKNITNDIYINDTSVISVCKYKRSKLGKKKFLIYKKKLEDYRKNKNIKKTIFSRTINKNGKIKVLKCKDYKLEDNLFNKNKNYDIFYKNIYHNILKKRVNIFIKRKKRNFNDENKDFFNNLRKETINKRKNIKWNNLYNNKDYYNNLIQNSNNNNITSDNYNINHYNFISTSHMKVFSNNLFCFNDTLKDTNKKKNEILSLESQFNKKSYVKKKEKGNKKKSNYFFNYYKNLRRNSYILNNESSKIYKNMNDCEKSFENCKNDLLEEKNFKYSEIVEKHNIYNQNLLTKNIHSFDEVFNYKSTNDNVFENSKNKENKNTNLNNLFKSIRGNISAEHLFQYSNELKESNLTISENNYYYYNKFKSFHNEKSDNSYNMRKIINNKINSEYYHLKLNILILSCIIIQISNSLILILISNNIIIKKEKIFFFCFLYSLLESVTDVISDNIFFLCGKFTDVYKKEINISSIYTLQVISKMVLSISTVFIYFIYHIFIFSYKQVNIMIINTFIKVFSIFILSILFLKNKDNIFNYYYDEKPLSFNYYYKKDDIYNSNSLNSTEMNSFQIMINKDKINISENTVSNYNYSNNKKLTKNIKKDKDNLYYPKKAFYNENYATNEFVNDDTEKKTRCMKLIFVKLKYITHIFNLFNLFPNIKKIFFKENNINYNYKLLTLENVKYDEENNKNVIKEKQNYLLKIPIIKNIKKLIDIKKLKYNSNEYISNIKNNNNLIRKEIEYMNEKKKKNKNINNIKLDKSGYEKYKYYDKMNNKKKIKINYPFKLFLNNLNFSNIFYICLLLIIPTFERIFLNYKIKNIIIDLDLYCYLNLVNHITDLAGLYIYISYFNEESYTSSIFLSSLINICLMSLRFLSLHNRYNQIGLLFLETVLKSLHKTFFYMPIFILVTKTYIKNIHNIMCSFYSSILDFSSFASCYFEYLIISYYNLEDSKNIRALVFISFLILHLLSLIIISKLKKT